MKTHGHTFLKQILDNIFLWYCVSMQCDVLGNRSKPQSTIVACRRVKGTAVCLSIVEAGHEHKSLRCPGLSYAARTE